MIKEIFAEHNVKIGDREEGLFETYYQNLISWNQKFNLTAITDKGEVVVKHFLDSVVAEKYFPYGASVVDVGSGAGFPAIPLKIVRSDIDITMLEALNKRVNFLQDTLAVLDLPGKALHLRAEEAACSAMRESFDVATARAVTNTKQLVQYLLPLVKVGGSAILYKGAEIEEELKEAEGAIKTLGGMLSRVDRVDFAGLGRSVVIIDKIFTTPKIYPKKKIK
ncbi:MAG TPA: 16S rRNA (guanine(527)-N(7))-methyltransferase RsmG [Clostridiales bacterium]|nr:16S rRNA (guanine(527)-N(7))-methyltransferase RsmG [Clostridiales bacterium]